MLLSLGADINLLVAQRESTIFFKNDVCQKEILPHLSLYSETKMGSISRAFLGV